MGSEDITIIAFAMTFFLFIFLMIRSKHKHELAKLDRLAEGNADRSLTTGELEDMIKKVVTEMTEPIERQLNELTRQLETGDPVPLLDHDEDRREGPAEDKTVGRKTRA